MNTIRHHHISQHHARSTVLAQLMQLWWLQKRRDFSWRMLFVTAYFAVIYIILIVGLYSGLSEHIHETPLPVDISFLVPMLAAAIVPADMLMKIIWRRSPVEMDDSLRTRPVGPKQWGLFVLADTAADVMQWMLPLAVAFAVALFVSVGMALASLLLTYSCVMVNALFQNCWRRAPGNAQTLPLLVGWLAWAALLYALTILTGIAMGIAGSDSGSGRLCDNTLLAVLLSMAVMLATNVAMCYVLHRYFCKMKNYNENAPRAHTAHTSGEVSLWRMEWTAVWRSKRLRTSLLVIAPIFLFNTYTQQLPTIITDFGFNPMLLLGVAFPSVILGQYGLGVEANYAHGIWTKPWPIATILINKFRFHSAICAIMAMCCLPAVAWLQMSLWTLIATLLFACGVFVLLMMPMCLFCSRFDLFSSAFFNYQGANKQMNIYSFIIFVPMLAYYAAAYFLSTTLANIVIAGLGILGLTLHVPFCKWLARLWQSRRYAMMERWCQ